MKTLIINNGTILIKELEDYFPESVTIEASNINTYIDTSHFDLIVISGGSNIPTVLRHPEYYKKEMDFIKNVDLPILGICLGSELIVKAFGGTLVELPEKHRGNILLEIIDPELKKYISKENILVQEGHNIAADILPDSFISCARSEHGIEIIKHTTKPIIGLQFHPELSNNKELLNWIYSVLLK